MLQLHIVNLMLTSMMIAASCTSVGKAQDMRLPKKLIATGWDAVDSQRLLDHLELMETRPFDGVVIEITGRSGENRPHRLRTAFHNQPWQQEWFDASVDRLRQCQFQQFTDNFVKLGANPGDVDWFDDVGWKAIVNHWRIAASVVRRSGFKGILFDPEPYTPPHAQFRYEAQPEHDQHSFNEYYSQARRRGREVMQAIVQECPDITVLCFFMNSASSQATGRADPHVALASLSYGLYPAFIDGWLDMAPPEVTLVDGCESAYLYNSQQQYLQAAVEIKGACQELVSPNNRAKYRKQVQVGFGVYLDAYWNSKDSEDGEWYIDGLGRPRIERLRKNLQTALRVSDQYVWMHSEKFRWWPTPDDRVNKKYWPEALPGCEDALRYVRDPVDYAKTKIAEQRAEGTLANATRNGNFAPKGNASPEGAPTSGTGDHSLAGWSTWQRSESKGTFSWDRSTGLAKPGAARAAGVSDGCFYQSLPVKPGQCWSVSAARKIAGRGQTSMRIRWQTRDGDWTLEVLDQLLYCSDRTNEWSEFFGVIEVPEGADRLAVLLTIEGQQSVDDTIWFDDVEIHRIK